MKQVKMSGPCLYFLFGVFALMPAQDRAEGIRVLLGQGSRPQQSVHCPSELSSYTATGTKPSQGFQEILFGWTRRNK